MTAGGNPCAPRGGATSEAGGFAKLPNAMVARGILAHLRPRALKVYLAILHADRSRTHTCWPGVKTLARWSGVPRSKVSGETAYLERHQLIEKNWIQIGGKPRRTYHVLQPSDPTYPDYRESCSVCTNTDHRGSCAVQDPVTGHLRGKVPRARRSDHRNPSITDYRNSHMPADYRDTKQTEADEKVRSRRGGGAGEPEGDARFASPREAASLASLPPVGKPSGEPKAASKETAEARLVEIRRMLKTFSSDRRFTKSIALRAGYTETEIQEALGNSYPPDSQYPENVAGSASHVQAGGKETASPGEAAIDYSRRCEATTREGLACVGRPLVGSPYCRWHQKRRERACVPVG
jgi:hypothetical protein